MNLGNFCLSLSVKDLEKSREFYSKLGFKPGNGDGKSWLVMQNGTTKIGLFKGHFERNMLTFNPGWGPDANRLESFTDVRELQRELVSAGITPDARVDEATTSGPGYFMLTDPDGNPILVDQHV